MLHKTEQQGVMLSFVIYDRGAVCLDRPKNEEPELEVHKVKMQVSLTKSFL